MVNEIALEEVYKENTLKKKSRDDSKKMLVTLSPDRIIRQLNFDNTAFPNLYACFLNFNKSFNDSLSVGIRYAGGMDNFYEGLGEVIRYPEEARAQKIQGKVIVNLKVNIDGQVVNYTILKSPHEILSEEALRVLKELEGKWFPAVLDGQPYETTISVPISFHLG